jgi:hypothetical protein
VCGAPARSGRGWAAGAELCAALLAGRSDAVIAADARGVLGILAPSGSGYAVEAIGSLDLIIPEALRKRHWEGYEQVMRTGKSRYGEGDVRPCRTAQGWQADFAEFTIVYVTAGWGTNGMAPLRDVTARFEELRLRKAADRNEFSLRRRSHS